MRTVRLGVVWACVALLMSTLIPLSVRTVTADEEEEARICRALAQEVIKQARDVCSAAGPNSACYAHDGVQATAAGEAKSLAVGQTVDLSAITALTTTPASPDTRNWGIAMLNIQADLPAESQGVRAVLFGDASLTAARTAGNADLPTLPVKTFDELPVLLRAGASPNLPRVAQFNAGQPAVIDGRNAKATWVRVRLETVVGWTPVNQVRIEGDPATLTVLNDLDILPLFAYPAPMQAFTLNTPRAEKQTCAEAASGLLIELDGDRTANLLVNGVNLALAKGVLLARAAPKDNLDIMAITGTATIKAYGTEVELNAGESVKVRLGGQDGLIAVAAPRQKAPYAFAALVGAPVTVLSGAMPCIAGVMSATPRVVVRSGPGVKEFTSLFYMQPGQTYIVEGQNTDKDGNPWWKLANANRAENWVEQAAVTTVGACEAVAKAEPGVFAAPGAEPGVPGGFAPTARTIWNSQVGPDQLVGECTTGALNFCPFMFAITPSGSNLIWKGQEVKNYLLRKVRENVFAYSGRNGVGDGTLKIVLVFTSPTTLSMTQTLVLDREPGCQHIIESTATLR